MAVANLSNILFATLLPGATRVTEGACDSWKGTVRDSTGVDRVAFIKMLPEKQLWSEVAAALIATALALPAPRPMLVKVERTELPDSQSWQDKEMSRIAFASEDAMHPSFKHFLRLNDAAKLRLLSWKHFNQTGVFDEWIANRDRHNGNLLYDGHDNFLLIDHSHAFFGANWNPHDLDPNATTPNKLVALSQPKSDGDKAAWRSSAINEARRYEKIDLNNLPTSGVTSNYASDQYVDALVVFLSDRIKNVVKLICTRVGIPELPM